MDDQKYTYDPEKFVSKEEKLKNFNPILIPVILGWKRQLTKHKNMGKRSIYYVSPCGRRLRNLVRFKMKRIFFERRNSIFSRIKELSNKIKELPKKVKDFKKPNKLKVN